MSATTGCRGTRFVFEELETRLLYSADLAQAAGMPLPASPSGGTHPAEKPGALLDARQLNHPAALAFECLLPQGAQDAAASTLVTPATAADPLRHEIVFVDMAVDGAAELLQGLQAAATPGRQLEIVAIPAGSDGLALITDTLAGRTGLDAVHILGHADGHGLQLGTTRLDGSTLSSHAQALAAWGTALQAQADLMFYGCDLGATTEGRALVQDMALLTGADVAASDDLTANAAHGGDWVLEVRTGTIESASVVSDALAANWSGSLLVLPGGVQTAAHTATAGTPEATTGPRSVVMDGQGRFTTIWSTGTDVAYQRFLADGTADAVAGTVNNVYAVYGAAAAGNGDGRFAVAYFEYFPGVLGLVLADAHIKLDVFDASGTRTASVTVAGTNLLEGLLGNVLTGTPQIAPTVAMDASGNIAVAWNVGNFMAVSWYDSAGTALGVQVIDAGAAASQVALAMGPSGTVLSWTRGGDGVFAQFYDTARVAQGGAVTVPGTATGVQSESTLAMDGNGRTLMTWSSTQDGSADIFGRWFSAAGTPLGAEFKLNTVTADAQTASSLSVDASGRAVVAWQSQGQDGSGAGIYWREILADGTLGDPEVRVNTTTAGDQVRPSVAGNGGQAVVVWTGLDAGSSTGVFFQRQVLAGNQVPVITSLGGGASASVSIAENNTQVATVTATDADLGAGQLVYSLAGGADAALFSIDAGTGVLRFLAAPDRDAPQDADGNSIYDVMVRVSDGSATDTQAVAVTVTGVNDEVPRITSLGGGAVATVNVAETLTTVVTVTAADADLPAQPLVYSIVGGADAARFAIDAGTGLLRFVSAPDYEAPADADGNNLYDVIVRSSDGTWFDEQAITVRVTDVSSQLVVGTVADTNDTGLGGSFTIEQLNARMGTDGAVSLREALIASNNTPGLDTIRFAITGPAGGLGEYTLLMGSALPTITDAVVIDGASQPGSSAHPLIVLDGNGVSGHGLTLGAMADGSTVRGLVIRGFGGDAIHIDAGSDNHVIAGNYLGSFNADGSDAGLARRNLSDGVESWGSNVRIGGATAAERNVIGGNAERGIYLDGVSTGTRVLGNYIGTDASGSVAVANGWGVSLAGLSSLTIGGAAAGEGNVISGNTLGGLLATNLRVVVQGNTVGLDATGLAVLGNGGHGVEIRTVLGSLIGGSAPGAGNVLSGNAGAGLAFYVSATALSPHVAQGNLIGTDRSAALLRGNGAQGVLVSASNVQVGGTAAGEGNVIAGNGGAGIGMDAGGGGIYLGNSIHHHGAPGIDLGLDGPTANDAGDLDLGPNFLNNAPALATAVSNGSVSVVSGSLQVPVLTVGTVRVEFYASAGPGAQGQRYLGSTLVTPVAGLASFSASNLAGVADGEWVTATLTLGGSLSGTSEFSNALQVSWTNALPQITSDGGAASASLSVAENSTAVTTVAAQDADVPLQTLSFAIAGGADASRFTIDAATGVLRFVSPPDLEDPGDADADAVYEVVVGVFDGVGGSDTQSLSITLTGINETAPVITSQGGAASASINVVQLGQSVTTVMATDADLPTAPLNYSITGGADAALFTIDAGTGALRFLLPPVWAVPLDSDVDNVYQVQVSASDGQWSDSQLLSVVVVPSNVHAPSITGAASVDVVENTSTVLQVTAQDLDVPVQHLNFSLTGGADAALFEIDADTGVLRFLQAPDHEQPFDADQDHVYELTVQVGDGLFSAQQSLVVRVLDANDQSPVFVGGSSFAVNENTSAVTMLSATDGDATPPVGGLVYSLAGGADAVHFVLDASTGGLSFAIAPDHEAPLDADADNRYDLVVQVSDGIFTAQRQLSVLVNDVNDNAPSFTGPAAWVMPENSFDIGLVAASDPDLPLGGSLSFSLAGGADAAWLRIDAASGLLSFVSAPDHETPQDADADNIYQVRVQVSDGQLITWRNITVQVGNVNEAPRATGDRFVLDEDETLAGTLADLLGNDLDGDSPVLSMRLVQGPSHGTLSIQPDGSWTYQPLADFHGNDSFTYVASDGVLDSAAATVQLQINPVNDAPLMTAGVLGLEVGPEAQWTLAELSAQAVDAEGDALSVHIVQAPQHGQLSLDQAGVLRYQADPGFAGQDTWAYTVTDGLTHSQAKAVALSVSLAPQEPPANPPGNPPGTPVSPSLPEAVPPGPLPPFAPRSASILVPPPGLDGAEGGPSDVPSPDDVLLSAAPTSSGQALSDGTGEPATDVSTALASDALSPLPPALPQDIAALPPPAQALAMPGLPSAPMLDFQIGLLKPPGDVLGNSSGALQLLERLNLDLNDGGRLTLPLQPVPSMNGGTLPTRIPFNGQSVEESRLAVLDSPVMQGSGVALSLGAVWWTARAAGLMTSMMVTVPAWRTIDPMPVMGGSVPPDAEGGEEGMSGNVTDEQSAMEAQAADMFSSVNVLQGETEGIG